MKTDLSHIVTCIVLAALAVSAGTRAFAGEELMGVDAQFRAKIAKEKIKIAALQRQNDPSGQSSTQGKCGSQSIGNVDTGGRIGAAPREVFVFAPNAINIAGQGSCQ